MLLPVTNAYAQAPGTSATAYFCNHANGAQYWQREPCAPGMEIRTGQLVDPTSRLVAAPTPGRSVESAANNTRPVESRQTPAPVETAATDVAKESKRSALRQAQFAFLKLLGFGLLFGVVAKMLGRSFWRWFALGAVVRVALVSANVLKF